MRILIAEDDDIIADGVSRSLGQAGYSVDWAAHGEAAEEALLAHSYDLLVLDLGLPRLSAWRCSSDCGRAIRLSRY